MTAVHSAQAAARAVPAPSDDRQLTAQGRERKEQLLECAAQLFAERGYDNTRVKDIVDAAGVAKGLFYWYFENKEAVFQELAVSIRQRLRRAQGGALDPAASPLARIGQATEASVRFMADNAPFFSLLEVEGSQFTRVLRAGTEQHITDVAALIKAAQDAGEVVEGDVRLLAVGVVGAVGYFTHFHRSGRIETGIDDLARFVADHVVRSLTP
jgi:AcrR family transcriptional regulator